MQGEHLLRRIEEVLASVTIEKPVLCVYNLSNVHWVAFAIIRRENGQLLTLYKDSYGNGNNGLYELLKERSLAFRPHPGVEQRGNGTRCGIMAMENVRMMARELNGNREQFINIFETYRFCTLDRALQLRQEDFPRFYTEGIAENARIAVEMAPRAVRMARDHHQEVEQIIQSLRAVLPPNIIVQNESAAADARRTIRVQIAAANSNLTDYIYWIKGTPDLDLPFIQEHLLRCQYVWSEGVDYRIENGVIKVFRKI